VYKGKELHHFYHIGSSGKWLQPLSEHIHALKRYGLLKKIDSLNFGIIGLIDDRNDVKKYLSSELDAFNIVAEADHGWEQVTLQPLYDFALENDGYILYAHTKSSNNHNIFGAKHRRSMTYFNVVNWKDCVEKLDEGYSLAGTHYCQMHLVKDAYGNEMDIPGETRWENIKKYDGFFLGNFWWTTTEAIKTLKPCANNYRQDAEFWIAQIKLENKMAYDFYPHQVFTEHEDKFITKW
jgi:hypothetical protein